MITRGALSDCCHDQLYYPIHSNMSTDLGFNIHGALVAAILNPLKISLYDQLTTAIIWSEEESL